MIRESNHCFFLQFGVLKGGVEHLVGSQSQLVSRRACQHGTDQAGASKGTSASLHTVNHLTRLDQAHKVYKRREVYGTIFKRSSNQIMVLGLIWLRTTETGPHSSQKQGLQTLWEGSVPMRLQLSWILEWYHANRTFHSSGRPHLTSSHTYLHQHICRKKCDPEVIEGEDSPERKSRPVLHVFVTQPYREQIYDGKNEGRKVRIQQEPPSNSRIWKETHMVRSPSSKHLRSQRYWHTYSFVQQVPLSKLGDSEVPVNTDFLSSLSTHHLRCTCITSSSCFSMKKLTDTLVLSLDLSNLSNRTLLIKLGTFTFPLKGGNVWFSLQ